MLLAERDVALTQRDALIAALSAVLDRDQFDHGQIKDLTRFDAHHGCIRQVSSAPETSRRGMDPDLVRHLPRLEPEPLIALLLTRLAPGGLTQRLRCGLAQPIAASVPRRRFGR